MTSERPTRLAERRSGAQPLWEGVPDHLRVALAEWAAFQLGAVPEPQIAPPFRLLDNQEAERQRRLVQTLLRAHVAVPRRPPLWLYDTVAQMIDGSGLAEEMLDEDDVLEILNMHLQICGGGADQLAEMLDAANSVWTVGGAPPRLFHRVSDEQQRQFDDATSEGGAPSELLTQAWTKIHGRSKDPTGAWADAVKAVEVLLAPIVAPNDSRPQLGKMIGYIAQAPHKWTTTLQRDKVTTLDVFVDALRVLYPNPGRHDDMVATREEAEAAVGLAVLIGSWLRVGAFRRADPSP